MLRIQTVAIFFLSTVAFGDADERFTKLRDQAEALASLSSFVEKYVGDCGPKMIASGCEKNSAVFRRGATGKKFYMIVTEESSGVLSLGDANLKAGTFVLNMTPFFSASNIGLSQGTPTKTDANGNPLLPFLKIESKMPENWDMGMVARQTSARAFRIQIVFTPEGVWTLPKRGGGAIHGIKAKFDAVLVQVGRTGEHVGMYLGK
jgi:hypothetical protein